MARSQTPRGTVAGRKAVTRRRAAKVAAAQAPVSLGSDTFRNCEACGSDHMLQFRGREGARTAWGRTVVVPGLVGWCCEKVDGGCGAVVFDSESERRWGAAGEWLVAAHREEAGRAGGFALGGMEGVDVMAGPETRQ